MFRFALVAPAGSGESFARLAHRLKGGKITAVATGEQAEAIDIARRLEASVWAQSPEELHSRHDDQFDAWLAPTDLGLIVAPHDNRPWDPDPKHWSDLAPGWLWGHPWRFSPAVRPIRDALDAGKLGPPGLVRIHDWRPAAHRVAASLLAQLDLACWLVGSAPKLLDARARPAGNASEPDYIQVHLGFTGDAMAVIDCASAPGQEAYYALSVIGASGAAHWDDHHNRQLLFSAEGARTWVSDFDELGLLAAIQEFIDSQSQRRPPSCGGEQWRRALAMYDAVTRSLAASETQALEVSP